MKEKDLKRLRQSHYDCPISVGDPVFDGWQLTFSLKTGRVTDVQFKMELFRKLSVKQQVETIHSMAECIKEHGK